VYSSAKSVSISSNALWRVANAVSEGSPFNLDRILGGSFNFRSALEAFLAHSPEFYMCKPGRIESRSATTEVRQGHKHLLWLPEKPHENGVLGFEETDVIISEAPSIETVYDALILPENSKSGLDKEAKRRHSQIQIAIVEIGVQLGFRTYIARNDQGITYRKKRLGEMDGVVVDLKKEKLISAYSDAAKAAALIDCVWFRNAKFMPAVIEVEHSTGVISGLSRMKNFQDALPPFPTRWIIAAPDELRAKVIKECNKEQFKSLNPQFFSYSAIEELYSLCRRRKIKGVSDEFLDCFIEPMIGAGEKSLN